MKRILLLCLVISAGVWLKPDTTGMSVVLTPVVSGFTRTGFAQTAPKQAVVETSATTCVIDLTPETAPNDIAYFTKLAQAGVYDGTAFHRIVPGFVIQTGARSNRAAPLTAKQQALVHNLSPEFNDTKHVKSIVSMARGDDPSSATTSFFICTGASPALDGQCTAFGQVVDGMAAVEAIEAAPRNGEAPTTSIDLKTVRIERVP